MQWAVLCKSSIINSLRSFSRSVTRLCYLDVLWTFLQSMIFIDIHHILIPHCRFVIASSNVSASLLIRILALHGQLSFVIKSRQGQHFHRQPGKSDVSENMLPYKLVYTCIHLLIELPPTKTMLLLWLHCKPGWIDVNEWLWSSYLKKKKRELLDILFIALILDMSSLPHGRTIA